MMLTTQQKRALTPWLFMAPGIVMFLVYVIWPIGQSLRLSFYQWDGLSPPTFIGWENYIELWYDPTFVVALKNNVIWLVLYMLAVPFGLFVALFLNQTVTGIRLVKSLFFFPFVISQVVGGPGVCLVLRSQQWPAKHCDRLVWHGSGQHSGR